MKPATLAAVVALSLPLSFTAARANLIQNGSFEQGIDPGSFTTVMPTEGNITSWIVGGNSVDYIGSYWQASNGTRSIDIAGNGPGTLSQSFNIQAGQLYRVSFDIAGNPDKASTKYLDLKVGVQGITTSFTNYPGVPTKEDMNWSRQSFTFQAATTGSTLLTFSVGRDGNGIIDNGAFGAALDNIDVSAVPLPASLPLFGLALLGLGGLTMANRRRSDASTTRTMVAA